MRNLAVQIVRCVDDMNFPGWLEVEFIDVEARHHAIVDKVPIFTADYLLDSKSLYPQPGTVQCEVLEGWQDSLGREDVSSMIDPGVESKEGLSEFVVLAVQLSEAGAPKTGP